MGETPLAWQNSRYGEYFWVRPKVKRCCGLFVSRRSGLTSDGAAGKPWRTKTADEGT